MKAVYKTTETLNQGTEHLMWLLCNAGPRKFDENDFKLLWLSINNFSPFWETLLALALKVFPSCFRAKKYIIVAHFAPFVTQTLLWPETSQRFKLAMQAIVTVITLLPVIKPEETRKIKNKSKIFTKCRGTLLHSLDNFNTLQTSGTECKLQQCLWGGDGNIGKDKYK